MNNSVDNNEELVFDNEKIEVLDLEQTSKIETITDNFIPEMIVENIDTHSEIPYLNNEVIEDNNVSSEELIENYDSNNDIVLKMEVPNEVGVENVETNLDFNNEDVLETLNSNDNVIDNNKNKTTSNSTNKINSFKNHFGFIKRVSLMGIFSIICFVIAVVLCYLAFNYSDAESIMYRENSSVTYSVCLNDNDYYKGRCQNSGMQYISSLTKSIPVTFDYNLNYSSAVDYKLEYYVLGKIVIYDRDDASKILYKEDKLVAERKTVDGTGLNARINSKVDVDFKEKNDFVNGYKSKYALNSLASYEIILYVDDGKGPKEVSSVTIPLSMQTFSLKEETVSNEKQIMISEDKGLFKINTLFGVFGIIFGFIGAIILFKLFKLIYKTIDSSTPYEKKLNQILAEYDRVIVISKSGYKINPDKQFIKLDSFFELLDARDTLEKPVIYEKVNNIKSHFYVEDDERIYRYAMKESDFESK